MRGSWAIPALFGILVLGTFGISQEAFAVTNISTCQFLSTPGETYVLTADISAISVTCFEITADNITLDGNGHTITGDGFFTNQGVTLTLRTGVTITNLTLESFAQGIRTVVTDDTVITGNTLSGNQVGMDLSGNNLSIIGNTISGTISGNAIGIGGGSGSNIISGNILSGNSVGIDVSNSNGNTISDNTVSGSANTGITLRTSSNNDVSGNTLPNNANAGIRLGSSSHGNNITGNNISNSNNGGIQLHQSDNNIISGNTMTNTGFGIVLFFPTNNNEIFNNNLIDTFGPQEFAGSIGNVFNRSAPTGGNYYDNFDESAEGCDDTNSDGFCDAPFVFTGNQDNLPWTTQNGWDFHDTDGVVGGTYIPIDTTALLLAEVQSISMWMIPVVVVGIGIGIFMIKRKNS